MTVRTGFAFLDEPIEQGAVLAFAHRGGALHPDAFGMENTLRAFATAVGLGYRYLETDVHATRDGQLLAFHDARLGRVTDLTGRVRQTAYGDLGAALVGGLEPIPRVADLLEEFPTARFSVDLKSPGAVDPMVELVMAHRAHDRLCVGSFSEPILRRFRARIRAVSRTPVATGCGVVTVAAARFGPRGRAVQRLLRDPGAVYQVPVRHRGIPIVTGAFVARAHSIDRQVHVWTVDDRDQMHALLDLGVDGLITDRTDVLKDVLVERGQWEGA